MLALDVGGEFQQNYDAIFRTFHSLKGAAGMMELIELQHHMHQVESLLVPFKDLAEIPKEYIDFFLRSIDAAKSILNGEPTVFEYSVAAGAADDKKPSATETSNSAVSENKAVAAAATAEPVSDEPAKRTGVADSALNEFIAECEEILERVSQCFGLLEKGVHDQDIIDLIYRDIHSLKGSSQLFGFAQLGQLAHAMESCLEPVRDNKSKVSDALADCLFQCMDLVDGMIAKIKAKQPLSFSSEVGVLVKNLTQFLGSSGEPVNNIPSPSNQSAQVQIPQDKPEPPTTASITKPAVAAAPSSEADKESSSTIRVSVGLLDRLMTLMGEMVLVRNQVLQYSNRSDDLEFLNLSQRLNVVTSEIQGEMMKTRMQPIGTVVNKFQRVVRDLAKELNKKIDLNISGAETELDKTLLEAVKDPLTHIIRNSVDHGVETPSDRVLAGKPESGTVCVRAYHEGGQVIVEVQDDGKGLHRDKLLAKGIEKGIVTSEKAATMTEREIMNLIFAPGFSTAAQVTNVSGRGVGMDVVRSNIDRIGGAVEIDSVAGKGTTIKLKIPLTLAIVPAMIVRCGDDRYAIPQVKLVELLRVERNSGENKIEFLQGKPVYRLRGNILPLLDLKKVLSFPNENGDAAEPEAINIVVLNAENQFFGMIVDEILDTADIVVKPLSRFLKSIPVYSGATVLGDGSVALILDVAGIASQHHLNSDRKNEGANKDLSTVDGRLKSPDAQEFLLFKLNSPTKHAVFLGYVHRLEEFNRGSIEISGAQRIVRYRNSVLPIISLNQFLGYPADEKANTSELSSVIVTQRGDQFYGIEVNEILDVLTSEDNVDISTVDRDGILGNLVTENEVIVIVDPQAITSGFIPKNGNSIAQSTIKGVAGKVLSTDSMREQDKEILSEQLGQMTRASMQSRREVADVNILFVEDTAFFRKHVSNVLSKAGYKLTIANDGEQAMQILNNSQRGQFDLILSDIEMPKMNGFELAVALRKHQSWRDIPLIALTTRSENRNVEEGLKAGFNLYLEKMNPPELLEAIDSITSELRKAS